MDKDRNYQNPERLQGQKDDRRGLKGMKGRTILVTGSTDGIGLQTVLQLARLGATVILHGRDMGKGQAVTEQIRRESGNHHLDLFIADLASMRAVRRLASEVRQSQAQLHVLINNAGVFMPSRRLTEDGCETTFAVNCLAPFLLSLELLPIQAKSIPSRIVTGAYRTITNYINPGLLPHISPFQKGFPKLLQVSY
jgi:NAD(P)-dependent dehydrogenase (short-subunit alcohol dehydrogenase family)